MKRDRARPRPEAQLSGRPTPASSWWIWEAGPRREPSARKPLGAASSPERLLLSPAGRLPGSAGVGTAAQVPASSCRPRGSPSASPSPCSSRGRRGLGVAVGWDFAPVLLAPPGGCQGSEGRAAYSRLLGPPVSCSASLPRPAAPRPPGRQCGFCSVSASAAMDRPPAPGGPHAWLPGWTFPTKDFPRL